MYYRDVDQARAAERRQALIDSLQAPDLKSLYIHPQLAPQIGLPYKPRLVGADYFAWPKVPDLFPVSFPGVKTSRDEALVDIDRERLEARMKQYFDMAISHDQMRQIAPSLMREATRFRAAAVRDTLRTRGYRPETLVRYRLMCAGCIGRVKPNSLMKTR